MNAIEARTLVERWLAAIGVELDAHMWPHTMSETGLADARACHMRHVLVVALQEQSSLGDMLTRETAARLDSAAEIKSKRERKAA